MNTFILFSSFYHISYFFQIEIFIILLILSHFYFSNLEICTFSFFCHFYHFSNWNMCTFLIFVFSSYFGRCSHFYYFCNFITFVTFPNEKISVLLLFCHFITFWTSQIKAYAHFHFVTFRIKRYIFFIIYSFLWHFKLFKLRDMHKFIIFVISSHFKIEIYIIFYYFLYLIIFLKFSNVKICTLLLVFHLFTFWIFKLNDM